MMKLLWLPGFIALATSMWACGGDGDSALSTPQPSAADLFGKETDPFEVAFAPDISVSDDTTLSIYWREANGVRRIDVVEIRHDGGKPSGSFLVEIATGASEDDPGRICRWSFNLNDKFYSECQVYIGGLTLDSFIDAFLRLMDSRVEGESVNEALAGREAVCVDVKGSGNLPEGFQVQDGRVCLGIEPNVPLYMANDTKALKFSATNVTLPLGSTDFIQDVPAVPVGDPYPTIESLRLPESAEPTVIAYASR